MNGLGVYFIILIHRHYKCFQRDSGDLTVVISE
jgi:hypothetical protein